MQIEARYQMGMLAPYAFYDGGKVTTNKPQPSAVGDGGLAVLRRQR